MDETGLGTLARQGARWTLTFSRKLSHPREKVWRAVTEPEHLAVWYPQEIVGERRAGAPLRFVTPGSGGDGFDGQMLVFEPPSVMEFTWGTDLLRIELVPDGAAGTVLTLTDTFDDLGKAARDAAPRPRRAVEEDPPGLRERARARGLHHRPAPGLGRAHTRSAMNPCRITRGQR
jgi:uncharacterized protein YndB with AHSA1/START domain